MPDGLFSGDSDVGHYRSFEDVCERAAREHWCWNLYCTTCGHGDFTRALEKLAREHGPAGQRGEGGRRSPLADDLVSPRERSLQAACRDADLARIANACPFPDWLGYLGLVLAHTPWAERLEGTLTAAWTPQLMAMVPPGSEAHERLRAITTERRERLTLADLELVESELQGRLRR